MTISITSAADVAKEATSLINKNILNQVNIAVQAQANGSQKNILRLISG